MRSAWEWLICRSISGRTAVGRKTRVYPGGITSLCVLALLSSGVEVADPKIQLALSYLRGLDPPGKVYTASLQTMVFCAAEPDKDAPLIRRNVDWLQSVQIAAGPSKGRGRIRAGKAKGTTPTANSRCLACTKRSGLASWCGPRSGKTPTTTGVAARRTMAPGAMNSRRISRASVLRRPAA